MKDVIREFGRLDYLQNEVWVPADWLQPFGAAGQDTVGLHLECLPGGA